MVCATYTVYMCLYRNACSILSVHTYSIYTHIHHTNTLQDKVLNLEQDAGAEFRQRMAALKRQLESAKTRAEGAESQLSSSRQHAEQYKEMSLANEKALAELNKTTEEFRSLPSCFHTT